MKGLGLGIGEWGLMMMDWIGGRNLLVKEKQRRIR